MAKAKRRPARKQRGRKRPGGNKRGGKKRGWKRVAAVVTLIAGVACLVCLGAFHRFVADRRAV